MIDIESEVFNIVHSKVVLLYPKLFMVGEYVESPSSFPCASLVEVDNFAYQETQTTDSVENHASVMYELNVYSNKSKGKKAECKKIAACIDEIMGSLGFTRTMLNPVPNMNDATVYRLLGRYKAVVSANKKIYRR